MAFLILPPRVESVTKVTCSSTVVTWYIPPPPPQDSFLVAEWPIRALSERPPRQ